MKKLFLLLLMVVSLSPLAFGQAGKAKPFWVLNPVHYEGKSSKLVTLNDYGMTKEEAKKRIFQSLHQEGRRLNEGYRIVEEFWDFQGNWAYGYFLVQVANDKRTKQWERVELNTTKYPFSARCFIPGMAQIYKGSKGKGSVIIIGEALGAAGIVTSFSMKASNERLIQEDRKHASTYADRADMWQNIGFGCIAFTAVFYVYNFIDGAVAHGKKHIQIGSKSYNYAFAPMLTTQGDMGLAMRINLNN